MAKQAKRMMIGCFVFIFRPSSTNRNCIATLTSLWFYAPRSLEGRAEARLVLSLADLMRPAYSQNDASSTLDRLDNSKSGEGLPTHSA